MIGEPAILAEMVQRIVSRTNPRRVVLFGSRARGDAGPNSDYDLLVIADSNEPRHRRSAPLYTLLADLPTEVELAYYTPAEVEEWQNVRQSFIGTVLNEGVVVYERP